MTASESGDRKLNPEPENVCTDCGTDTIRTGHYYLLHDSLWHAVTRGDESIRFLCILCAERRLGREFISDDFDEEAACNISRGHRNEIVRTRMGEVFEILQAKFLEEEALQPEKWWWLSFVGGTRNGVVVVQSKSYDAAVAKAWKLGLNPGGEVKGFEYDHSPAPGYENRFLTIGELKAADLIE